MKRLRVQSRSRVRLIAGLAVALAAYSLGATESAKPDSSGEASPTANASLPAQESVAEAPITGEYRPPCSIEIPEHPLVERYRAQYTSEEGKKYLSAVMKRSVLYRAFILEETRRLGVPECLLYLPVIESGFTSGAVSRSGATGVWQFMRNSVSGYGIRMSEWLDERRDPWITTTAALRKLSDNYRDLGNWPLALAAYNCGLGATRKAVKKGGTSDYWELCRLGLFKKETVHYVPKFLAISEILSQSETLAIDWGKPEPIGSFITVPVKRPVDLSVIAKETDTDPRLMKSINPALHYSITPPDAVYGLRIPAMTEERVRSVLEDRTKMLLEYYLYKVKSGDTLFALALHYGVSVDMILQYNPGVKPNTLKISQKLVIPAIKEVTAYSGKKDRTDLDFSGTYLVKKGDTLWSIALAHEIQVETLAERNNLEVSAVLSLGKQLRVPIL